MNGRELLKILHEIAGKRIAVVGDLMLDRYIWGEAKRISQEAPVPVVRVAKSNDTPGGAANVAGNILGLGGDCVLYGTIGNDAEGDQLLNLLKDKGANIDGVIADSDYMTTVKTRVIANHQQVVRIDNENGKPIKLENLESIEEKLVAGIKNKKFDAIIFEDYAKGLLERDFIQRILDSARNHDVFCALDPHPSHAFNIHGLHLMTPNRSEAFGLAGAYYRSATMPLKNDTPLLEVGHSLQKNWAVENLLITLGGDGMALFADSGVTHIPTRARDVFDVSGAGDTVTATFVLAVLAGATPVEAAHFANYAAGLVVAKVGTTPVDAKELERILETSNE